MIVTRCKITDISQKYTHCTLIFKICRGAPDDDGFRSQHVPFEGRNTDRVVKRNTLYLCTYGSAYGYSHSVCHTGLSKLCLVMVF
jgi:hypothetical protein